MQNNDLYIKGNVCGSPRIVKQLDNTNQPSKVEFVVIPNDAFDTPGTDEHNSILVNVYGLQLCKSVLHKIKSGQKIELHLHVKSFKYKDFDNKFGYEAILEYYNVLNYG